MDWTMMRRMPINPLRENLAAMLEILASQRPDLLQVYLDMACNSPARFAMLELAADCSLRDTKDLGQTVLKATADLDRLERRRGGWKHPRDVVHRPNVGGLLVFCHARLQNVTGIGRRRRLEFIARRLQRVHERERTMAWITDFIGTTGQAQVGPA